ncbi:multicopper oxidase family protein [Actinophytocola sediminis]
MPNEPSPRRRRRSLRILLAIVVPLVVGTGALGVYYLQASVDTVGEVHFGERLAIPPIADSRVDAAGTRVFDLDIRAGETRFLDGQATRTAGVNGSFLGPTIRARRGEHVAINVHNGLHEATSLHWHGMHVPAAMDGGPHQTVAPGDVWNPKWTVEQPAATLWYHPHLHGKTAEHAYLGVSGMFILDDDTTAAMNLPDTYGVDDLPLIVQDRAFDDANQFDGSVPFLGNLGALGDEILVNGVRGPYTEVSTRLVRLRLLNASNARIYHFGFADDRGFRLIGTDGGLLAAPWETTRLQLSPGERVEIVVAFTPGETTELRSYPGGEGLEGFGARLNGGADRFDVLQFRVADRLTDTTEVPAVLGAAPDVDTDEVAEVRSFELAGREINGETMAMDRVDFAVRKGSTEIWEVVNTNGYPHNFHVHDVQFQVIEVAGGQPPPPLRGWKDTVLLPPDKEYRLAMRFSDHADQDSPYMYHCHLLTHEDEGMMGQFVVLGEGERIGRVPAAGHDHP